MALNERYKNGWLLSLVVTNPTVPVSGDPVRCGVITGVAQTDERADGTTSVDLGPTTWLLSVKGVDDAGNSAVALYDPLFYVDGDTPHLSKKASGYFFGYALETLLTGTTGTIHVAHVPSPGAGTLAAGSVGASSLGGAFVGTSDGNGVMRVARATFDPSGTAGHRTIAAHGLGVTIPDNAIVCGGFVDSDVTATSATDAATIALSVQGANDIVSAIAISNGANPWDAGLHPIIPKANTPETTGIKLTAAREITATVAVEALLLGHFTVFVYYVVGA